MRGPLPLPISLTDRQRAVLERITRCTTYPHALVIRAQVLLRAHAGDRNRMIATALSVHIETPRIWRRRWASTAADLASVEDQMDDDTLHHFILELLADAPRSGAPATFSPEQICRIIALACEDPAASGRPVTHWTPPELAREAVKRGIVERISPRSVGRFLKGGRPQAAPVALLADARSF